MNLICRILYAAIFLVCLLAGLFFYGPMVHAVGRAFEAKPETRGEPQYWVSRMNPSVHFDRPGKDSTGMKLVPVYSGQQPPPAPVMIDPTLQERDYTTAKVERGPLVRTIQTVSTVAYAEPLVGDVSLKVDAWLEKLFVDYEGQSVRKGDPLYDVYAPDLVSSQEDLLSSQDALEEARKTNERVLIQSTEQNLELVRRRLRYLDVTDDQIEQMAKEQQPHKAVRYFSPFSGIVVNKQAFEGQYFPAGRLLYEIADLSKVWVYLYVYPDQIHCVEEGQHATLVLPELPDQTFEGKVLYIYPYLEPKIRAVKVRLEFNNPDLVLKPDMFGHVSLAPHEMGVGLKIPERAVLDTGMRKLVYLTRPGHRFEAREVQTGMELDGGMIEVLSGLDEGDEIVLSEEFIIDSESRLRLVNRKFEPIDVQPGRAAGVSEPVNSSEETEAATGESSAAENPGDAGKQ